MASVISRAYRRDHLVGRVTGNGFVVVTHHDPRQLAAAILQAVRDRAAGERRLDPPAERWGDRRIEVSVGALRGIPRSAAAPGRLSGAVMLAERAAQRARSLGSDRSVIEDYDADVGLPGPVGLQRRAGERAPARPGTSRARSRTPASSGCRWSRWASPSSSCRTTRPRRRPP